MRAIARGLDSGLSAFEANVSSGYELVEVPSDQVDEEMLIADASSEIPAVLQGIWWMDGNPLPDELLSLGASIWDPEIRTTRIQVYGERVWSWHGNILGRLLYALVRTSGLVYELQGDHDLSFFTITPIIGFHGKQVRVPGWAVRFTMRLVRDGHWLRESLFFGLFYHAYDLRRVVRGDGSRLEAFAEYVASAPATSYLAVRRGKLP